MKLSLRQWATMSALALLLLLLFTSVATAAKDCSGVTIPSPNPVETIMTSGVDSQYQDCAIARCKVTTSVPNPNPTGWQCDASEDTATCKEIDTAYTQYFGCILKVFMDLPPPGTPGTELDFYNMIMLYAKAPGFPFHLSDIGCYSLAAFKNLAAPQVAVGCRHPTFEECCALNPGSPLGEPGKGYNEVLCGVGCMTALLMTAFVGVSATMFLACYCCWPSPSLKTTVARMAAEEEEERQREREEEREHEEGEEEARLNEEEGKSSQAAGAVLDRSVADKKGRPSNHCPDEEEEKPHDSESF